MPKLFWRERPAKGSPNSQQSEVEVDDQAPLPVVLYWGDTDNAEKEILATDHGVPTRNFPLENQLRQPIRYADSVTITCAAAGDYAAGDVWSASATNNAGGPTYVRFLAPFQGATFTLAAVRCISSNASLLNSMRLQWFTGPPQVNEVEMDDNAVFAFTTAQGRALWAGSTLLNPFTTKGTSDTTNINDPLRPAPQETGMWLVLTTETAETNEAANQTVRLDFYTF